jgi:hypothetical protein
MNYCSLEEAWGTNTSSTPKGHNTHIEHKKKFENENPIHTPNINYECSLSQVPKTRTKETLTGYQNKSLANYQPGSPIVASKQAFNKMNNQNQDLDSFIRTLNIDEATKTILISKISSAIDSVKYESSADSSNDIREEFGNRYYNPSHSENRNVDILFLILLGLFVIFILDKK